MAYRRKFRKFKRKFRRKGRKYKGRGRKVHYKVSKQRFAPRWADCALTKLETECINVYNSNPSDAGYFFACNNTDSNISLVSDASATGDAIRLRIVPFINSGSPAVFGSCYHCGPGPETSDLTCTLPTFNSISPRYTGFRVMAAVFRVTIRPADRGANAEGTPFAATAPPMLLWHFPYQNNDNDKGNFWDERAFTLTPILKPENVNSLKYSGVKRLQGFGAQRSQVTKKFVWYPWKIYGMTRQQWLSDPKAFFYVDEDDTTPEYAAKHHPYILFGVADYNKDTVRDWQTDIKVKYYIRWEGQKFLTS